MEVSYTQVIFTIERSILKILYKIEVKCYLLFMCESISAASNPRTNPGYLKNLVIFYETKGQSCHSSSIHPSPLISPPPPFTIWKIPGKKMPHTPPRTRMPSFWCSHCIIEDTPSPPLPFSPPPPTSCVIGYIRLWNVLNKKIVKENNLPSLCDDTPK